MSEPAEAPGASRWGVVFLVVGVAMFGAFQIGKLPSALPTLRTELGLDLIAAGWVISMFNVVGVSAGIAVGAMADAIGHRRAILFGLLCMAAGGAMGALAAGAPLLLASRFAEGLGAIVVFVAGPGLIVRAIRPGDRGLAFGIWGAYMPAGMALMVLATPPLLGLVGWRGLWLVNAGLLLLAAVVMSVATRDLSRPAARRKLGETLAGLRRDVALVLSVPGPLLLALCFSTYTANFIAVLGFLPTFLIEERGMAALPAAALTALAIAANVPGNLLGGWLLHRGARRWVLVALASTVMAAASFGIYAEAVPDGLRYALCLVFSGLGGMLPASILGGGPVHAPRSDLIATVNGLIVQGANLGQFVGPPALAALVAAAGGWQASPWQIAGFAAVGVMLALWIGALERRKAAL